MQEPHIGGGVKGLQAPDIALPIDEKAWYLLLAAGILPHLVSSVCHTTELFLAEVVATIKRYVLDQVPGQVAGQHL